MSAATPISWTEHTADELHELAKHCGDAKQASRARAIAMIMDGASRTEAARAQGMELQILRDWVLRYNAEGFEGLADRPRGGSEGRLTEAQIAEVGAWIEAGPDLERDGVTRWRVQDIVRKIEEAFGVIYTDSGARMMLRRAGFRFVSGRPVHPKADAERQRAFVAGFEATLTSTLSAEALAGPVEIWFQDEARVGQKGMTTRVWANGKQRPRIVRDHRYGYVYLFGATCAERGVGIAHVADRANTASMNEHLAAIGAAVAPGAHGVIVLDGAGWHRSGDLLVPPNLTLLHLPPYSPELNPMEQIILFLKSNRFANRVFKDVAALKEACRTGWQWLTDQPDVITKTTRRNWAVAPSC